MTQLEYLQLTRAEQICVDYYVARYVRACYSQDIAPDSLDRVHIEALEEFRSGRWQQDLQVKAAGVTDNREPARMVYHQYISPKGDY